MLTDPKNPVPFDQADPPRTMINGSSRPWTPEIWALWRERVVPSLDPTEIVTTVNYFTPRPFVSEEDPGNKTAGFMFVLAHRKVCFTKWVT